MGHACPDGQVVERGVRTLKEVLEPSPLRKKRAGREVGSIREVTLKDRFGSGVVAAERARATAARVESTCVFLVAGRLARQF